jgi:hypothetical protein
MTLHNVSFGKNQRRREREEMVREDKKLLGMHIVNMEKVMVDKITAEELQEQVRHLGGKENVVKAKINNTWSNSAYCLNRISVDMLIRALYYGYEVEPSVEERLKRLYNGYQESIYSDDFEEKGTGLTGTQAIKEVLDILGKQIKGINC